MCNNLRYIVLVGAAYLGCCATAPPAMSAGAVDSFRVRQLYSNQSGYSQFIELEEVAGKNDQDQLAGITLKVTNRAGVTKTFVFPTNLPNSSTANRRVTIASQELADSLAFPECISCAAVITDYVMPNLFLPTDGGTIELAGDTPWTFDTLPTDGVNALLRTGESAMNGALTFAGNKVSEYYGTGIFIVEYYNAGLGHFFRSGSQPDIDALDSGRIAGWSRTDDSFIAYSLPRANGFFDAPGPASPVCRYYIPPDQGNSHFFSAAADECDAVAEQHPDYVLETRAAFYAWLPDRETGHCPYECVMYGPCTVPVYRLWNNRPDSGHRYTTGRDERDAMVTEGWISEGYGPNGVAMCVQ